MIFGKWHVKTNYLRHVIVSFIKLIVSRLTLRCSNSNTKKKLERIIILEREPPLRIFGKTISSNQPLILWNKY